MKIKLQYALAHFKSARNIIRVYRVADFSLQTDRIPASLATAPGQIPVSTNPATWAALQAPTVNGDVIAADLSQSQKMKWITPPWNANTTGWIAFPDTATYASPTTFTIPGDHTAVFRKGTKIYLTQTTAKYFYVISSSYSAPNTTVTVTGGTDYSLANAAIVNPYYSYDENPQGHPIWFNYTVSWTADITQPSIGNGTLEGKFCIKGKNVTALIGMSCGSTTTYGSGAYYWSIPLPAASFAVTGIVAVGNMYILDSGSAWRTCQAIVPSSGSNILGQADNINVRINPTSPMTWANGDQMTAHITYEMA